MQTGQSEEAPTTSPPSISFQDKLEEIVLSESLELRARTNAIADCTEKVTSFESLLMLARAAEEELRDSKEERLKKYYFSYVQQIQIIIARIRNEKLKGNQYDA